LVAVVVRHTFNGTGLRQFFCVRVYALGFVGFGFINFFYVSIRTTENYEFDTIRTA